MTDYKSIRTAEEELLRARDRARIMEAVERELSLATAALERLDAVLSQPDDQSELISDLMTRSQALDSRWMTRSSLGVGGGKIVRDMVFQVLSDAMVSATRMRASLETSRPELVKRVEDAQRAMDRQRQRMVADVVATVASAAPEPVSKPAVTGHLAKTVASLMG